jgi:hypothetical protein
MDLINRIFEAKMGMTYEKWHRTVFQKAEKYRNHSKEAMAAYKEAVRILELYEEYEVKLLYKK